jgi:hypothetical protein
LILAVDNDLWLWHFARAPPGWVIVSTSSLTTGLRRNLVSTAVEVVAAESLENVFGVVSATLRHSIFGTTHFLANLSDEMSRKNEPAAVSGGNKAAVHSEKGRG